MRKKFINDHVGFIVLLFLLSLSLLFLYFPIRYAYTSPNPMAVIVAFSILFGVTSLICLLWLILRTEIIAVYSDSIVYWCCAKKTIIYISDISQIIQTKKITYGLEGYKYDCWKIVDSAGRSISIVQTNNRKQTINIIKEQAKVLISLDQPNESADPRG